MDNTQTPLEEKSAPNHIHLPIIALAGVALLVVGVGVGFLLKQAKKPATDASLSSELSIAVSPDAEISSSPSTTSTKISVVEEGKIILTGGYADPTVVRTATGYRMYVNRQSGGPNGYIAYTSTDGIAWTKEKEFGLNGGATGRAVIFPTGVRLYYPGAQPIKPSDPPADMFSSFSTDGLNFTKDPGTVLKAKDADHYVEGPTVFQLPDKSWRMYFNENSTAAGNQRDGIIWGASSKDGVTWTRDSQPTLEASTTELGNSPQWKQVLHPFVLANPKGGYIMFYNSHSEIFAATSTDGLTWNKIGKVGIHGADIDGYFESDDTIRVFYGDFSEETQGVVYMGVLKVQ